MNLLSLLMCLLLLEAGSAVVALADENAGAAKNRWTNSNKMEYDGGLWCKSGGATCKPDMRGRCGKRRGDWYGARQPVADVSEARELLQNYFSGQGYTISGVIEKRWGFRAGIIDKDGNVIDRVMIDKRSGRIRSLY